MKTRIQNIQEAIAKAIQNDIASNNFTSPAIQQGGQLLHELGLLLKQLEKFEERLNEVKVVADSFIISPKASLTEQSEAKSFTKQLINMSENWKNPSAKAEGKLRRERFIKDVRSQGIDITPFKGGTYVLPQYEKVGIASATEKNPNKWFMGLPKGLSRAVLIADHNGQEMRFVFSKEFYADILPDLSISGEQLKFNVLLKNHRWFLKINNRDAIDIMAMLENFDNLR